MNPQLNFMLQQAIQAFQNNHLERADSILKKVLQADSKNLAALHILGLIKASQGKFKEAIELLTKAVRINPNEASIQYNLAKAMVDFGANQESIPHHKKAVELASNNPEAWLNYGKTLAQLKLHQEALIAFDKAIAINSNLAEAWSNKGNALHQLKQFQEAIVCFDKALNLKPDFAEAWINYGSALEQIKQYQEAINCFDKALNLKPNLAEAWSNKGGSLLKFKQHPEAIKCFETALNLKPEVEWGYGSLVNLKMRICAWDNFPENLEMLCNMVQSNSKVSHPFNMLSLIDNGALHQKTAEIYSNALYPINPTLGVIPKIPRHEKIRIGYFSADFRHHAVSILTAELFELHDKNKFELTAFSFGPDDQSLMRARLTKAFDKFIDVSSMSEMEIAKLARELEIDIAVDLGGFTLDCRTGIFAYRAAPIQISYIGYLGTMGAKYMDYLLAEQTIIPEDSRQFYSEKIIYLPSYQVNDSNRKIADKVFTREELGLAKKSFVFACFNNSYKILPAVFDSWMRILKAVENSVLFLYAENEWTQSNLINEAQKRGIESERIVFGKYLPADENLARYKACDLFLDTTPYNAGTTASDALWVGLPVLTLMGKSFASRVAASLLNAIDLPELITSTLDSYESKAIELAHNPQKLEAIKRKLSQNRGSARLFDTPKFTKNIELAYTKMYERYQADLAPDHIIIE
jgi:protein O-GlcNAc transferase